MSPPRVPSSACTFCAQEEETLLHLLFNCNHVSRFWKIFIDTFGKGLGFQTPLNPETVLLGNSQFPKIANFLLLVAKRYIYSVRCNKKELHFANYMNYVQQVQKTEFFIANRKKTN